MMFVQHGRQAMWIIPKGVGSEVNATMNMVQKLTTLEESSRLAQSNGPKTNHVLEECSRLSQSNVLSLHSGKCYCYSFNNIYSE